MTHSLPNRPSIEFLHKEAKGLLKAHRSGDRKVCDVLRNLERFVRAKDADVLSARLSLHEAQLALARDYGFASWPQLKANIVGITCRDTNDCNADRVVVQGVRHANFDIHWDMHVRAVAALLAFRGVDAGLSELLAVSGDAFSLCHASHFQGTGYLASPINPVRCLTEAYGFAYHSTHAGPTGPFRWGKSADELATCTRAVLDRVHAEIDAGRPVIATGAEAHCGSTSIVVGYDRRTDWLCHVGDGRAYRWTPLRGISDGAIHQEMGLVDGRSRGPVTPGFVGGWQAYPFFVIGERTVEPDEASRICQALKLAIDTHSAAPGHRRNWGGVDYYFGADAYERWAAELECLDYPADLSGPYETNGVEDAMDWYEMGNMDMQVDQIVTGRSAAASFCRRAADVLGAASRAALKEAADAYDTQVSLARDRFAAFIPRFDGNDQPRRRWLSDRQSCLAGAHTIREMLRYEQLAINAIKRVAIS